MEIKNAEIIKVAIELHHGCLTCWVYLDYGDFTQQGFGGLCLYNPEYRGMEQEETNFAGRYLHNLLTTFGGGSLTDLEGKTCRVKLNDSGEIEMLGHILKDVWFTPKKPPEVHLNSAARMAMSPKKGAVPLADGRYIELYDS